MAPTRDIWGFVPSNWIFLVILIAAFVLFALRAYRLVDLLKIGQAENRLGSLGDRVNALLVYVIGQRRLFKELGPGLMHAFIFWGFLVLTVGTINIMIKGLVPGSGGTDKGWGIPILDGNPVFLLVTDFFLAAVTVAVLVAFYRRWVVKPARLTLSRDAIFILSLILTLVVTEMLAEGFGMVWEGHVSWWAPLGASVASILGGPSGGATWAWAGFGVMWWGHILTLLYFLTYLPQSKHLHIMTAPFNVFFRNLEIPGALTKLDIENSETFGASTLKDFGWKHLLDLYTCTECGRCQDNCPAYLSGKPLSPKALILDLKHYLLEDGPAIRAAAKNGKDGASQPSEGGPEVREMIRGVIQEETLWACTTCRHCVEACPVFIEHVDKIVDMRRNLVLMEGSMAPEVATAFKSTETAGNPLQLPASQRAEWAKPLGVKSLAENPEVEYLFFVGCVSSYDQRNVEIAVALAKILQAAGISFGILGAEEKCCGEPVRRIGNEYLYQMIVQENIEYFNNYNVKKIVTACPHCFNTLKNEYPQFGGNYEVIHHAQLLLDLVRSGKLKPSKRLDKTITYHDSCYLGRYNDIYNQPRELLQSIPGVKLVEMKRTKSLSFCCGGGGGHTWMEEHTGQRINQMRVDQAMEVKPDILGSACPFCMMMFDDGIKAKGYEERMQAYDIAELIAKAIEDVPSSGLGAPSAESADSKPTG